MTLVSTTLKVSRTNLSVKFHRPLDWVDGRTNKLLLPKVPKYPRSSNLHKGKVAVNTSNTRWCSDGFEIKCDSKETVAVVFTKDCGDREVIAHRSWLGKGLPSAPVSSMLIEAVETHFDSVDGVPLGTLEFLSDNG